MLRPSSFTSQQPEICRVFINLSVKCKPKTRNSWSMEVFMLSVESYKFLHTVCNHMILPPSIEIPLWLFLYVHVHMQLTQKRAIVHMCISCHAGYTKEKESEVMVVFPPNKDVWYFWHMYGCVVRHVQQYVQEKSRRDVVSQCMHHTHFYTGRRGDTLYVQQCYSAGETVQWMPLATDSNSTN